VNDINLGLGAATLDVCMDDRYCSFGYRIALTLGIMGVDPCVDRGTCPPTFEVEGTPCVLSPLLFGVDIFNAQLHSKNYSSQFISSMLTPLGSNRRVPFHVVITNYDNDVTVMSPLCSCVAPQTLYI